MIATEVPTQPEAIMNTLLQIQTSLFAGQGQSSQLAARYVSAWQERHPRGTVTVRDLAASPLPHLTAERFTAFGTAPTSRTPGQQAIVAESDALVDELRAADTIVLGLPMYNFGVPSTLKAYFDHVARAGVTFQYTANGPVGLLTGKRAIVFATRGGRYVGTPRDTETTYVRDFLAFIGITEVEFVYAEGLAMGETVRNAALESAHAAISRLEQPEALAA